MKTLQLPQLLGPLPRISFWRPVVALGVLTLLIPFFIKEETIETTKYVYIAMMVPAVAIHILTYYLRHTQFSNWMMTVVILSVSAPVLCILGVVFLIVIVLCRFIYVFLWLVLMLIQGIRHVLALLIYNTPWMETKPVFKHVRYRGSILNKEGVFSDYFLIWLGATIIVFMVGAGVKPKGDRSMPDEPCVYLFNHSSSFLDYFLMVYGMGYKKKWKVVYGVNLHKYPVFKFFLKNVGIGVDRNDRTSKMNLAPTITAALRAGYNVAVAPEGTRMRSHQVSQVLLRFKPGAFLGALDANAPIKPIVLCFPGFYSWPDKKWPLHPQDITMIYLPSIATTGKTKETLMSEAYPLMKNVLIPYMRR